MFPRERFFRSRKTNPPRSRAARIENTDTQKEIRARRSRALRSRGCAAFSGFCACRGLTLSNAAFPSKRFVPAFCASRERAPEARHNTKKPHAQAWGRLDQKEKRVSEKRHNHPARGGAADCVASPRLCRCGNARGAAAQKKREKVLVRALFFFVRIGVKEMRHAPAGTLRRFRSREIFIVLFPTIQIAS